MPDYDAGFKIVAHVAGQQLAELGGLHCQQWEPISGEVQATERLADRAFRATSHRQRFVVYMEAYTRWQTAAPWSVLAKSGLLSERERLPTVSLVYILLPRGYRPQQGTFQLGVESQPTQQIWFREICLWQQKPTPWWEQFPGLMTLYPLCQHRQTSQQEVLAHAAQVITDRVADRSQRADLLTTLGIFGKLAFPGTDVFHMIGRTAMKESKFYQEIMQEGRIEARREDILDFLEGRFGPPTVEIVEKLQDFNDLEQLSELVRLAARCRRLSEFLRAVERFGEKVK